MAGWARTPPPSRGGHADVDRPPCRHPRPPRGPRRRRARWSPPTTTEHPDPADPGAAGRVRHLRAPRLVAQRDLQRGPHRRDQPGDLRVPRRRRAPTARCSSAATRTRCPSRPGSPRWRCSPPTACTVLVDSRDGYTPTPALSHAILQLQPRPHRRAGRRRRGHAVAQPAAPTAASSTTRPTAARPTPTPPGGSRTGPTSCSAAKLDGVRRRPLRRGRAATPRRATTSSATYVADLPSVIDIDAIRDAGVRIGADPLGGASVAYWGEIAERLRPRPDRGQPERRPDVRVHDPRLGRQDPDGLLVAVRDGLADRAAADASHIATGNDADADRHGIVTPDAG